MRRDVLHVPVVDATADVDAARRLLPAVRLLERRIARIRRTPAWLRHRGREELSPGMVTVHRTCALPMLPMVAVEVDEEPASRITDLSDGQPGVSILNHGQTVGMSTDARTRIDFAHNVVGCTRVALEVLATGIECPCSDDMTAVMRNLSRLVVETHPELDEEIVHVATANLWAGFSVRTPLGDRRAVNLATELSWTGAQKPRFDHWATDPDIAFLSLHFAGDSIVVNRPQHARTPHHHDDGIGALRDAATDARLMAIVDAVRERHGVA